MKRLAVLDLGSNSFHVLVADTGDDGRVDPVLREREMLHLSRVVTRTGRIEGPALDEAVQVAGHLAELARRAGADELRAVATSAIRDAANRQEVLDRLGDASGVDVHLLSGIEEAQLSYLGARASVAVETGPTLVLDLGGGSLEVVIGDDVDVRWAVSLPLGATRLAAEFATSDPLPKSAAEAVRTEVRHQLQDTVAPVAHAAPKTVILLGGAVRALARVHIDDWRPLSVNMVPLEQRDLRALSKHLRSLDEAARNDIEPKRGDHIHVAALTLATATEVLGIERSYVSDWGLREGVLLSARGIETLPDAHELRARGVQMLADAFEGDAAHSEHVTRFALALFDATHPLHGYGARTRELLEAGIRLHDIGRAVALKHHERHGAYLVEQAGLRGYEPWEVAVIGTLVRCHNSDSPKTSFPPYASLDDERQTVATKLLALLQLADSLDRPRDQAVRDISARLRGDVLHLSLHGPVPDAALLTVRRQAAPFERVFGCRVEVVDRVGVET